MPVPPLIFQFCAGFCVGVLISLFFWRRCTTKLHNDFDRQRIDTSARWVEEIAAMRGKASTPPSPIKGFTMLPYVYGATGTIAAYREQTSWPWVKQSDTCWSADIGRPYDQIYVKYVEDATNRYWFCVSRSKTRREVPIPYRRNRFATPHVHDC